LQRDASSNVLALALSDFDAGSDVLALALSDFDADSAAHGAAQCVADDSTIPNKHCRSGEAAVDILDLAAAATALTAAAIAIAILAAATRLDHGLVWSLDSWGCQFEQERVPVQGNRVPRDLVRDRGSRWGI
jgi:hypothetical protein